MNDLIKNKRSYYFIYALCFSLIAIFLLLMFRIQGNTLINYYGDGFRQHYRALIYYGKLLKEILKTGHIPMWDFVIAEGNDILQTLHYYGVGDPFNLPLIFIPEGYVHIWYELAIFIRLFLGGIGFSLLCFKTNLKNKTGILLGALTYDFCAFCLHAPLRHPFFSIAPLYLPFIILGVEKIIKNEKPYLLSISVFLCSVSNIYFFYMIVLIVIFYVIIRLIFLKEDIKDKLLYLFKIALYSFIGLLMSAVIFLPMVNFLLNNSRVGGTNEIDLFYSSYYYKDLLCSFTMNSFNYFGGFGILGLIFVINFVIAKQNKTLITCLITSIIIICLPIFGSVFNGFSYVTDRWNFFFGLLISYIVAYSYEKLPKDNIKTICFKTVFITLYYFICIKFDSERNKIYVLYFAGTIFTLFVLNYLKNKKLKDVYCILLVLFTCAFPILNGYSPIWWNFGQRGKSLEDIYNMKNEIEYAIDEINDENFYRYTGNYLDTNCTILGEHSSSQYYWSIANDYVSNFRKDIGLLDHSSYHYDNYNNRYSLLNLASMKYFVKEKYETIVPYGYEFYKNINGYDIYVNNDILPIVYVYDDYISYDDYLNLDVVSKQEVLLQTIVLDKESKSTDYNLNSINIEYEIKEENGIHFNSGEIIIEEDESSIVLGAKGEIEGEYYLVFDNLDGSSRNDFEIETSSISTTMIFKDKSYVTYSNRHDFIVNLGYFKNFNDDIKITIPNKGIMSYDNVRVVCLPIKEQNEYIDKLKDLNIESINVGKDNVTANISLDKDKIVCFGIPYSKGWKAYIDGKEADTMVGNVQYIAINVEKGEHNIELRYSTPLLKTGVVISLVGSFMLIGTIVYNKKRQNDENA